MRVWGVHLYGFLSLFFFIRGGPRFVVSFTGEYSLYLFQSFLCQGVAPRALRLVLSKVTGESEYSLQFEKDSQVEYCFIVYWDEDKLKKICVDIQSLDEKLPNAELKPIARLFFGLESRRLPMVVRGASPSLMRVLGDRRDDSRRFVVYQRFTEEVFLECFQRAHQDVFGMVEIVTLVEFIVQRMKSAVYEDWTEGKPLLRKCIRNGCVNFWELRELLTDLTELWHIIRPYIRCTGLPYAKEKADRVSTFPCVLLLYHIEWC